MPLASTYPKSAPSTSTSTVSSAGSGQGLGPGGCGRLLRGQYEGYRSEEGVGPVSATDTFAMAVLRMRERVEDKEVGEGEGQDLGDGSDVGNVNDGGDSGVGGLCDRWRGVPMVLVAGKGMIKKEASVRIEYRANTPTTTISKSTTTIMANKAISDSDNGVLKELLDVVDEVRTEVTRLQALRGKGSPTATSTPVVNDGISDDKGCVGLALVLQIQPQPGLYIETQYQQQKIVLTEREELLSLADLLSCPSHDPLGQALQLWPSSPQSSPARLSPVPVPTEAYTRILQALLTSPSPSPAHREDASASTPVTATVSASAHDRLFVSQEEVGLQWALFDHALAHNAMDAVATLTRDAAVDSKDLAGTRIGITNTNTLIRYAVGSDVESVLRGSELGVD